MSRAVRIVSLWAPPVAVMAVIFTLSSMPSGTEERGALYLIVRKLGHFSEYALLCACWWRALRSSTTAGRAALGGFALASVYAATDEFHQTFVDNRVGTPVDVLIDATGAASAALVLALAGDAVRRRLRRPLLRASRGR